MELFLIIILIGLFFIGRGYFLEWQNKRRIKKSFGDINIDEELNQPRHLKKMNLDRFWTIIDKSRQNYINQIQQLDIIREIINNFSTYELIEFSNRYKELKKKLYTWDLWAVFYLLNGGCSDDSFDYYRGWLVFQGKVNYYSALQNPESILSFFKSEDDPELFNGCITDSYFEKTGKNIIPGIFYQENNPKGKEWNEDDLPIRFPMIYNKINKNAP